MSVPAVAAPSAANGMIGSKRQAGSIRELPPIEPRGDGLAANTPEQAQHATTSQKGAVLQDAADHFSAFSRWELDASGKRWAVSSLRLAGLTCAACALPIEWALSQVPGVRQATVQAAAERAEVHWDPSLARVSDLISAVTRAGYRAAPDVAADVQAMRREEMRSMVWRVFVAGFCMMQVMMVAAPTYFAEPGEIAPDLVALLNWAAWIMSLPVVLFAAKPFLQGAWRAVRRGRISMDVPVALGVVVTFVASTGAAFDPHGVFGQAVYFDSLTMFVFFLLAGRWFEMSARHRAALSLETAADTTGLMAERRTPRGQVEKVPVAHLRADDVVLAPAGESFVADGLLLSGPTAVDESLLTGESEPVLRAAGESVLAGSVNQGGPVWLRVLRLGQDTRQAGIVALMRQAMTERPEATATADRVAGFFIWFVLLLALGAAGAWWTVEPERAVWVVVSVLVVTCPCALALATPAALLAASAGLARRGVLLRRLAAVETLAKVDTVVFDKTGTLSAGGVRCLGWQSLAAPEPSGNVLQRAALLASLSVHPYARAVALACPAESAGSTTSDWSEVQDVPGFGLRARWVDHTWWRLGRPDWVDAQSSSRVGAAEPVWFGREGNPASLAFTFAEEAREDAQATIAGLQAKGLRVLLVSGDSAGRVRDMADRLGIREWHAATSPEGKLALIAQLQRDGRCVAMVGDGLNDAPVLGRADVSFAFAQGAAVAQAHADGVLLGERLGAVAQARQLALRVQRVIRQNLAWAALYNTACIPLALLGYLPPWLAGLGMACSSLFVVLNASRLALPDRQGGSNQMH
jgi:Cu2+-exporting ATPase